MKHLSIRLSAWWRRRPRSGPRVSGVAPGPTVGPRSVATSSSWQTWRIDDPLGGCTIVSIVGHMVDGTVAALSNSCRDLAPRSYVYIDLTSATIDDGPSIRSLEAWIGTLESRGFRVRVTGISPEDPALHA